MAANTTGVWTFEMTFLSELTFDPFIKNDPGGYEGAANLAAFVAKLYRSLYPGGWAGRRGVHLLA
jgi:hypothetical protein